MKSVKGISNVAFVIGLLSIIFMGALNSRDTEDELGFSVQEHEVSSRAPLRTKRNTESTETGPVIAIPTTETTQGCTVEGVVSSEVGGPIGNARISLGGLTATTMKDGSFSISNLRPGLCSMIVRGSGFLSRHETVSLEPGSNTINPTLQQSRQVLVIASTDQGKSLQEMLREHLGSPSLLLTAIAAQHHPITSVPISSRSTPLGSIWSEFKSSTNSQGVRDFAEKALGTEKAMNAIGAIQVPVGSSAFVSLTSRSTVFGWNEVRPDDEYVEFVLNSAQIDDRFCFLNLRVTLDQLANQEDPVVAEAAVMTHQAGGEFSEVSDRTGVRFGPLLPGIYRLVARARGYESLVTEIELKPDSLITRKEIHLFQVSDVRGQVVDDQGHGVACGLFFWRPSEIGKPDNNLDFRGIMQVRSKADGFFSSNQLGKGEYLVFPDAPGYSCNPWRITVAERNSTFKLDLQRGDKVSFEIIAPSRRSHSLKIYSVDGGLVGSWRLGHVCSPSVLLQPGTYKAQLFANGNLIDSQEFEVDTSNELTRLILGKK